MDSASIEKNYASSRERYAGLGVDTEKALASLGRIPLSLHCRQEADGASGTVAGEAENVRELRQDLHEAFTLIPGRHRLGLRAVHAESPEGLVERNALEPSHFRGWLEWAKQEGLKLDFSAACYGHPLASSGFTLSHREKDVRRFWIEHVRRCRKISASIGRELKTPCIHTLLVLDGSAGDAPFDRWTRRELLRESLDEIFDTEHSPSQMKDALESPPTGNGAFAVASHEFCIGYAMSRGKLLSLNLGRGFPAEPAADQISAVLQFSDEILIRVSRDIRWDDIRADIPDDGTLAMAREIVRSGAPDRVHIGLGDPDAGPNRVATWAAGARAMLKTLLVALLEPKGSLRELEERGDDAGRRALAEEFRGLPFGAVWDQYCLRSGVPPAALWRQAVSEYEKQARAGKP
jgi:L-rhamnose isomerase